MSTLLQDLRVGLRLLFKYPVVTLASLVCLAIGIGANSAIFSVVNSVLLQPLPFPDADRLVKVWEENQELDGPGGKASPANFLDWRERSQAFDGFAVWYTTSKTLRHGDTAEEVTTTRVTVDFFPLLGIQPLIGRGFQPEEVERQDPVVMMSHRLWQRRFGGDSGILDRTLQIDNESWRVAGVMPESFAMPDGEVDLWVPWDLRTHYAARGPSRGGRFVSAVARLASGTAIEQAAADLASIGHQLAEEFPDNNKGWEVHLSSLKEATVGNVRRSLWVLFGAVGFVLLIACANVASLLLARAAGRGREVALRSALGASRRRLLRQMLTESLVLALLGAVAGLALALLSLKWLAIAEPGALPRLTEISLDGRALAFTLAVALLTGILFGLIPAFQSSRRDLSASLKEGGKSSTGGASRHRLLNAIVVAEVALALLLLAGTGLLTFSFLRMKAVDSGFETENLLTFRMSVDRKLYPDNESASRFYLNLQRELSSIPGVEGVGATTSLPLSTINNDFDRPYYREDQPPVDLEEAPPAAFRIVTPGYFEAMGMKLLQGRTFTTDDNAEGPFTIIVNQSLAQRTWPQRSPIGQRLMIDFFWNGWQSYEVVGVVNDTRFYGPRQEPRPELFAPHARYPYSPMIVAMQGQVPPASLIQPTIQRSLALEPWQPPYHVKTSEQLFEDFLAKDRFTMMLFVFLAAAALILAVTGIYGVMAYLVNQRSRDFGLRMALGAEARNILQGVLRQGATLALLGIALGLVFSFGLTRVLGSLLFEISPTDPLVLGGVSALLALVALVACYLPARRATRVDPMIVLRDE